MSEKVFLPLPPLQACSTQWRLSHGSNIFRVSAVAVASPTQLFICKILSRLPWGILTCFWFKRALGPLGCVPAPVWWSNRAWPAVTVPYHSPLFICLSHPLCHFLHGVSWNLNGVMGISNPSFSGRPPAMQPVLATMERSYSDQSWQKH